MHSREISRASERSSLVSNCRPVLSVRAAPGARNAANATDDHVRNPPRYSPGLIGLLGRLLGVTCAARFSPRENDERHTDGKPPAAIRRTIAIHSRVHIATHAPGASFAPANEEYLEYRSSLLRLSCSIAFARAYARLSEHSNREQT